MKNENNENETIQVMTNIFPTQFENPWLQQKKL